MRIIRGIVHGQRDPSVLAAMRDRNCKSSVETIWAALVGNYQPEHVFAPEQALALYNFYQFRVDEWQALHDLAAAESQFRAGPRKSQSRPSMRTLPPLLGSAPHSRRHSLERPDPTRPVSPTTSPPATSNVDGLMLDRRPVV